MSLVSVLVVTLNRRDLAIKTVKPALDTAGVDYELLSVDNGSTDGVQDYIAGLNPVYHRFNETNEGYAPALNQMLLRAKGDYFCVLDPDFAVPDGWLKKLVEVNQAIPNSGTSSIWSVLGHYDPRVVNGYTIEVGPKVFGIKFFNRKVLDTFGGFCEEYAPYGPEDSDYMERINVHPDGYINYYLGGMTAQHLGDDAGSDNAYRKMKWDSLALAHPKFVANLARIASGEYYLPLPSIR